MSKRQAAAPVYVYSPRIVKTAGEEAAADANAWTTGDQTYYVCYAPARSPWLYSDETIARWPLPGTKRKKSNREEDWFVFETTGERWTDVLDYAIAFAKENPTLVVHIVATHPTGDVLMLALQNRCKVAKTTQAATQGPLHNKGGTLEHYEVDWLDTDPIRVRLLLERAQQSRLSKGGLV